jgi:hypothetical protein
MKRVAFSVAVAYAASLAACASPSPQLVTKLNVAYGTSLLPGNAWAAGYQKESANGGRAQCHARRLFIAGSYMDC